MTDKWISVDERVPDTSFKCDQYRYSADVLMFSDEILIQIGSYCKGEGWTEQGGSSARNVTHWCELPAPPEAKP